jgi:multicomponent Na+:H+ antiporter subunit E
LVKNKELGTFVFNSKLQKTLLSGFFLFPAEIPRIKATRGCKPKVGGRTMGLIAVFIMSYVLWLVLTAGTKGLLWSTEELVAGLIFAAIVGYTTKDIIGEKAERFLNPAKWLLAVAYAPVLFWGMVKANLSVAWLVITGRIRPGIVRVPVDLDNDAQYTIMSNSITLTPGTLTIEACPKEKALYVHWIKIPKGFERPESSEPVAGPFEKWARRLGR